MMKKDVARTEEIRVGRIESSRNLKGMAAR